MQPKLSAVWPTGGPAAGGSAVTLYGEGFDRFGSYPSNASAAALLSAPHGGAVEPGGAGGRALCVFGGQCFDKDDVHRGVGCGDDPATMATDAVMASPATLLDPGRLLCRSPPRAQLELAKRGRGAIRVAVALNAQNFVHKKTPIFVVLRRRLRRSPSARRPARRWAASRCASTAPTSPSLATRRSRAAAGINGGRSWRRRRTGWMRPSPR